MKERKLKLEKELKNLEVDLESLIQYNLTLGKVIRAMKHQRETWVKEKEYIKEEDVRVMKLEEKVRLLNNNLTNEEKEVSVWLALQDVQKEVSSLKSEE